MFFRRTKMNSESKMVPLTQEMLYVDFFRQCLFIIENDLWEVMIYGKTEVEVRIESKEKMDINKLLIN